MQECCPAQDRLVELLDASLSREESDAIEKHVASCSACEEKLAELVSQDGGDWNSFRELLDTKSSDDPDTLPESEFDAESLARQLGDLGFEVQRELGRGGMGVVFAARQPAMQRTVAIKMLQWGALAGPQRIQRLLAEAQAIGQLNHENVLKIFDTIDGDGILGLVLEYADRGSLAELLRDGPLAEKDAVRIATQAAAGLAHAHANKILHRDIKPGNILLCSSEASECAKLADFGLAKDTDRTAELTGSLIIGTPTYMSPEQISGRHDEISMPSDVYSLGIVLYQMLVGAPPFRGPTPSAVHHLVTTQPPVPPRQIQPSISRDLETICLKCLEKSPSDRYSSAKELFEDLQRLSESRPILARRPSILQSVSKWCRRKPATAALVATILVATIATTSVWGALTAQLSQVNTELAGKNNDLLERNDELNIANEHLVEQREVLKSSLESTIALRNFIIRDLLANASPKERVEDAVEAGEEINEATADLTARELVFRGIKKLEGDGLEERFPNQPRVQADVLMTLSTLLGDMGEYDLSVDLAQRSLDIDPSADQEFDKDYFESLQSYAVTLISTGKFQRVVEISSLIAQRAGEHDEQEMRYAALHNMAGSYMMLDQPEVGVEFSEDALSGFTELYGPNDPMTLQVTSTHGQILQTLGRYDDAALVLAISVAGFTELVTEKHPRTISAIGKLASVLTSAKEFDRAIEMYNKQIELSKEVLGADHPKTLMAQANFGSCLYKSGAIAEGVDVMTEARLKLIGKLGPDHYFAKEIGEQIEKAKKLLD